MTRQKDSQASCMLLSLPYAGVRPFGGLDVNLGRVPWCAQIGPPFLFGFPPIGMGCYHQAKTSILGERLKLEHPLPMSIVTMVGFQFKNWDAILKQAKGKCNHTF